MKAVDDVINDVTSDVIFHIKKLLLNPFLHIKGGKYEGSRFDTHERASSGLSKNRSRFANRPSWAELLRAKSTIFVISKRNRDIALRINYARWQSTRPHMCLSKLERGIRVGKKFS